MSDNQSIFDELLAGFHKTGILPHLTLIGSWCLAVFRVYFNNSPEIPVLRTMDLDILIPQNLNLEYEIDIPQMLKKYGFDEEFSNEKEKLRKIFQSMHKKWQLKTISVVKEHSPLLYNYLKRE